MFGRFPLIEAGLGFPGLRCAPVLVPHTKPFQSLTHPGGSTERAKAVDIF